MKGFHISGSGAIQGHHGPLVLITLGIKQFENAFGKGENISNQETSMTFAYNLEALL